MSMTPEEMEEYEKQLEDTEIKALLIQQIGYLDMILGELQGAQSESEMVKCTMCYERVPLDERQKHAIEVHNSPPDPDVSEMYEVVE